MTKNKNVENQNIIDQHISALIIILNENYVQISEVVTVNRQNRHFHFHLDSTNSNHYFRYHYFHQIFVPVVVIKSHTTEQTKTQDILFVTLPQYPTKEIIEMSKSTVDNYDRQVNLLNSFKYSHN